jgi:hypothetical protein
MTQAIGQQFSFIGTQNSAIQESKDPSTINGGKHLSLLLLDQLIQSNQQSWHY